MRKKLYLYNSLTNKKEQFKPIKKGLVSMYTCGPTVYGNPTIGNFRSYVFADVLKRTLLFNGYSVKHVVNITDVGHLTDDEDQGEDKIEKKAKEESKTAQEIAHMYTNQFIQDANELNIIKANKYPKATEHIKEQIEIIKNLEQKGFTYKTSDGIYFDTHKLKTYGKLSNIVPEEEAHGRIGTNNEKKSPHDFALWKFSPEDVQRQMEWDSPWGVGFPGWHIECSAMSYKYLGFPFDIHTGGIDHKPVHHENEIAQNEVYCGTQSVNYWLHNDFMTVDGNKMSKSLGNLYTLSDCVQKGFSPMALRYLYLTTHYRQVLAFSWDSLSQAQSAYNNLIEHLQRSSTKTQFTFRYIFNFLRYYDIKRYWTKKFTHAINDDLNTPRALAVIWELLKNESIPAHIKIPLVISFDRVLGLKLREYVEQDIPEEIRALAQKREELRKKKEWAKGDELRREIEVRGYILEDTKEGFRILKK